MKHALPGLAARILAALAILTTASPAFPGWQPVDISVRPIERFHIVSSRTRFGALDYAGGFVMRSGDSRFGQISGLRFTAPGTDFLGVADHGYWFAGSIERDAQGRPGGISGFRMQPVAGPDGDLDADKHYVDAEGLEIDGDIATVVFEREHRISEYRFGDDAIGAPLRSLDIVIPRHELRYNQGLETVARSPKESHLQGARVIVAERSIDESGNLFAAILEGSERGVFKVVRSDGFDATDGVFLPDGDLLLLERRAAPTFGVAMRIRRIAGASIRPGALVDGEVLMEADLAHQIDNMEAIDTWLREDGVTMISLMSDDNQHFFQRSLYLEFELVEERE